MPDVFLSYSREDQAIARRFATGLEGAGFSVWWDATLEPGEAYDEVTEKALLEAKAVIVLWSPRSVTSRWVRAEATQADRNKTLLPVMIEPCTRPIMFELTQTADLTGWRGNEDDAAWRSFIAGVRRFVGRGEPLGAASQVPQPASVPPRRRMPLLALALAALLLTGGATYWSLANRADGTAAARSTTPRTLAVLPFADLSAEKDQEYFSDGLAEELLNELSQIKELRVAGRTSSFSFKGRNEDLRVIGQKLGVANILEGSVRKSGNRLRITAQLIDAADGSHLWSSTYDRELSDIFAVQEEIAMAVSDALSVTLDVGAMSRANGGTTDIAAYDKFLKAQVANFRGSSLGDVQQASQLYREALTLDPRFARAWYGLHRNLEQQRVWAGEAVQVREEMDSVQERLVALAPQAWFTHSVRALDLVYQRKWAEAETAVEAALKASSRVETQLAYGVFLERVGRSKEAVEHIRQAAAAEPLSASISMSLQVALDMAGQPDQAQTEYLRGKTLEGRNLIGEFFAVQRAWSREPVDEAGVDAVIRAVTADTSTPRMFGITLDNWRDRPAALAALRKSYASMPRADAILAAIADHYGDKELVLEVLRKHLVENNQPQILTLWQFNASGWRQDPRYKQILADLGLAAYFRASGKWPDTCRPLSADDFECR